MNATQDHQTAGSGMSASLTTTDASLDGAQYSLFRRHEQSFCIDVAHLQEVLQTSHVTPVPQAPHALAGVMNLRGEVLPVVLMDTWLRLPDLPYDPARPVLVLRRKELLVGIQVDSVQRVGFVPRAEVLPSPLSAHSPIWAGIWFRPDQDLTTMLDGGALLDVIYSQIVHRGSGAGPEPTRKSQTPTDIKS